MIKAIFLDVDGTLISFRNHRIPASAIEALKQAHQRGVRIFIATGRAAGDLADLEEIPYDGVAALNGADCRLRDGTLIANKLIPRADFDRAAVLAAEFDFPLALELDEGTYVDRVTPLVVDMARQVAHPVPEQTDLGVLFDRGGCCQMCFYMPVAQQAEIMARVPELTASRWCPHFADINVRGVDKAAGIAAVSAYYGMTVDEVMAIGDGGNDLPMLRAAGIGVAMGNACPEAKDAADYVTADIDDDGIRKALEYFGVI